MEKVIIDTEKLTRALTMEEQPNEDEKTAGEVYDRDRVLKNIRDLMKKKNIKVGRIEKEAGCQPGYLSRLEKQGNTTSPSLEFIITAAKLLEVSVDYLLHGSVDAVTPTEEFVLEFIHTLTDDTRAFSQEWMKETTTQLKKVELSDHDAWKTTHPLFTFESRRKPNGKDIFYDSRFFQDATVEICGNCYHTQLAGTQTQIYLMDCFREEDDMEDGIAFFYELYLVNKDGVDPICCTAETCESIAGAVDELYKEIEVASAHVHIGSEARGTINAYMQFRKAVNDLPF